MPRTIAFVVYPGFSLINLSGPASVLQTTNYLLERSGKKRAYAVEVLSSAGGVVMSHDGIGVSTRALADLPAARVHTALVVGAHLEFLLALKLQPSLRRWIERAADTATRFGSVCTGAYILASLGLLDGKRVATHWFACAALSEKFPAVTFDANSLYVADGNTWSSAGASAGIDMALAMVDSDLGDSMASDVAKGLVVYARRPGYQSQFSALLLAQAKAGSPFDELTHWLQANLHRPLDVPSLARRLALSERSFYRKFVAATGKSPSRFIEALRLDAARTLLSQGLTLKAVAAQVGLAPSARLTRAFERRFGIPPSFFRKMHAKALPSP